MKETKEIKETPVVIEGEAFIVPGGTLASRSEHLGGETLIKSADFWTIKVQKSPTETYRAAMSVRWSDWANELTNAPLGTRVRVTLVPTGDKWAAPAGGKTVISCVLQEIEVVKLGTFPRSQRTILRWNPQEAVDTEATAEVSDR